MRPFWTTIQYGEKRPLYMGRAWEDYLRRRYVVILFPFNHLLGALRALYWRISDRNPSKAEKLLEDKLEKVRHDAYNEGNQAGIDFVLRKLWIIEPGGGIKHISDLTEIDEISKVLEEIEIEREKHR